jgi:hypothetical protein
MFPLVRLLGARIAAAIAAGSALAAGGASAATTKPPTPAQVRAAVKTAIHSKQIWSTVNICNGEHHRDTIGIRGQMPSLGFPSSLYMVVQIDYWNYSAKQFEPDPGVRQTVSLGDPSNQIVQGGATFKFKPPAVLSGTITFEWKLQGKVIGSKRRATGGGHHNAKYGDPPGYSSNDCFVNP